MARRYGPLGNPPRVKCVCGGLYREYRWFLVRTAPLRDQQENLVKWYGVSIDIEDRKWAEEAVRSSERNSTTCPLNWMMSAPSVGRGSGRMASNGKLGKRSYQTLNVIWSKQTHRIFETDPVSFPLTVQSSANSFIRRTARESGCGLCMASPRPAFSFARWSIRIVMLSRWPHQNYRGAVRAFP